MIDTRNLRFTAALLRDGASCGQYAADQLDEAAKNIDDLQQRIAELEQRGEPTQEQIAQGLMALLQCTRSELDDYIPKQFDGYENDVKRVWAAMIAAAPSPEEK